MKIESRMRQVLSEAQIDTSTLDLVRAAEMLALGLRKDLPDSPIEAVDYLMVTVRALVRNRPKVVQALRSMRNNLKAQTLLRQVRKEQM
jgi:hypothetical protein